MTYHEYEVDSDGPRDHCHGREAEAADTRENVVLLRSKISPEINDQDLYLEIGVLQRVCAVPEEIKDQ